MKFSVCLALALIVSGAQAVCPPGSGGEDCKPCSDGTYSLDGACVACPLQAMCRSLPGPCQRRPPCNKVTGQPTSTCWVDKPDGAACKPGLRGDQPAPSGPVTHTCKSSTCVEAKPINPGDGNACPAQPACKRLQLPCEVAPKCRNGRPTSRCWVPARDGAPCHPRRGGAKPLPGYTCRQRQCLKTTPSPSPATSCPDTPMCRRLGLECEMAPPCDADGRPTSMCWVNKPEGTGCSEAGQPGLCSGGQCVVSAPVLNPGEGACPTTPACERTGGVCEQAPMCDASGRAAGMCWVQKPDGAACTQNGANGSCKKGECNV